LNRRFLIDGEHGRVIRRIHVQPNHVRGLSLKVRIIREHVALEPMRLQSGALPRLGDEVVADLQQAAERARTPVRAAGRRPLPRLRQDARFHRGRQHRRRLTAIARLQPLETIRQEAAAPSIDVVAVARDRGLDRRVRITIRQHQDHPGAARVLGSDLESADASLELRSFIAGQCQPHMARQSTSTASVRTSH
jgi:hypothetical protein